MTGLRIRLLGPPLATVDGEPIDVDTRKATALLAYLAVTDRPQSRDALAALLWPDRDGPHARAALRRTLSVLNRGLGGVGLDIRRDVVRLDPASAWVDVAAFDALAASTRQHGHGERDGCPRCVAPLSEAADLHRGAFMEGFSLRDAPDFDDWQLFRSERSRRDLGNVLEQLVRALAGTGDVREALSRADAWLRLDPLNEVAHRWLMLLFARTGDRAAAQRQYRACVEVLERELGVAPLPETTELYRSIVADDVALGGTSAPPPEPSRPGGTPPGAAVPDAVRALPLVGRETEIARLRGAYGAIVRDGAFWAIEGEAGIGKTRLAHEVMASSAESGAHVVAVAAFPEEAGIAYGVVAELLRGALALDPDATSRVPAAHLAEVARIVPEVDERLDDRPQQVALDSPGAQARFLQAIGRVLDATLPAAVPGIVLLDDLQWADTASLDAIAYLVKRLRGRPYLVLAAWRPEGLPSGHPVRRLSALADAAAAIVRLGRLSAADVAELSRRVTGEDGAGERLYALTEGLPFFCAEYLSRPADLDRSAEAMPGGVRELLQARLEPLSPAAAQVVTTAAVIGPTFDVDTVVRASGRSADEAASALEELVRWRLVAEAPGGYAFRHERLREVVYEEAGLARRRLLHGRVADAIAGARDAGQLGARAAVVALHLRLAGREDEAAEHSRAAGDHARALFANDEALEHYRRALALGHPDVPRLREALGDLHTLRGEYTEALRAYEAAAASARDPDVLARLEHQLATLHLRRGDVQTALVHLDAAAAADADGEPAFAAIVEADRALAAHRLGDADAAAAAARRALEAARAASDAAAIAKAYNVLGVLARTAGDLRVARTHLERSLEHAADLRDPTPRIAALNNLALTLGAAGEHEDALSSALTALGVCALQGDRHREAALLNNIADLLRAAGRTEDAMDHLKRAVAIFAEVGEGPVSDPEIWKLVEW